MYEVIIVGGGPGGCAAGVYAARKKMKALLITESFGGQSIVSDSIGNWIGSVDISGVDLAKSLEDHVKAQEDIEFAEPERAESIKKISDDPVPVFEVKTNKNTYQTYSLILSMGGRRRKLNVPGEDKYNGKGVVYCSTCDAPLFRGRDVAVIGGGNAGLEAAVDLLPYAEKITLIVRGDKLKGDPSTQEEVINNLKIEIIYNADTQEIFGEVMVTGLKYKDLKTDEIKELKLGGVFIEIGSVPNSEIVKDLVDINERGQVVVDHKLFSTSQEGIYAVGDLVDGLYQQNNISVGQGVVATLSCYNYILKIRPKIK